MIKKVFELKKIADEGQLYNPEIVKQWAEGLTPEEVKICFVLMDEM